MVQPMGWGIEILRDGKALLEHGKRFASGGAYHPWTVGEEKVIKEYVMLDFRASVPAVPHPDPTPLPYHLPERLSAVSCLGL